MSYGSPAEPGDGATPDGPSFGPPDAGPPRRAPLALASVVCGVLGVLLTVIGSVLALVLAIAALVTGWIARRRVAASGGLLTGGTMSLVGIVLGCLPLLWLVVSVILVLTGVVDVPDNRR